MATAVTVPAARAPGLDVFASGPRLVLVDGRSGSGKTTLAARLAVDHPDWQVVHGDDLYPGWFGLAAAWDLSTLWGQRPGHRRWDWERQCWGGWVDLDPQRPVLVEGCGVLTPANAARADVTVWCHADPATCRRRALARDPYFAEHWAGWAVQQELHIWRHRPRELADVVVT